MRKCPDCTEENINETLFCKHCGRCLLAPDPEVRQRSTAMYTEHQKIHEGIDFFDSLVVKNSRVGWLKPSSETAPGVIAWWLFLLNLLAFLLLSEIARYIVSR